MKRTIGWIGYIWLLAVDVMEQLIEDAIKRFLVRVSSAGDSRNPHLEERFKVSPPAAIR